MYLGSHVAQSCGFLVAEEGPLQGLLWELWMGKDLQFCGLWEESDGSWKVCAYILFYCANHYRAFC